MAKKKISTSAPAIGPVYLVQERVSEAIPEEYLEFLEEMDDDEDSSISLADGWEPVKAFADKNAADAFCAERENNQRAKENPFSRGKELSDWSNFDAPRFHDWLLDAGLEPPKKKKIKGEDWRAWWEKNHQKMTALQRAKVWEATNKVRFFEVVELND